MIEGIEAVSSLRGRGRRGHRRHHARRRPRPGRVGARSSRRGTTTGARSSPRPTRCIEAVVATADSLLVLQLAVGGVAPRPLRPRRHRPPSRSTCPSWARWPGSSGSRERDEAFFSFTSFARPPTLYRWTPGRRRRLEPAAASHDGDGDGPAAATYVVEQVRYPSTDGTDDPDVPRPGRRHRARPRHAVRPHRLRRVRHHDGPGLQRRGRGGLRRRRHLRRGQHPRRRRGGRGLAPRRHARAQAAESSTTSSPPPTGWSTEGSPRATGSPSGAAATAACSWARPSPSAPTSAGPPRSRCRCSTWCATTASSSPGCGSPSTATPTGADEFDWLLRLLAVPPRRRRHLLPGGAAHHAPRATRGSTRCTPARWRPACRRRPSCGDDRPVLLREETRAGHGQGKPVSTSRPTSWPTCSAFLCWQLGVTAEPVADRCALGSV